MAKIKVLFVIDRIMVGGAEQVFIDILKLMQGRVEPSILLISHTKPKQLMRLNGLGKIYEINRKSKLGISSLIKTYRIIKSVDLLHVHLRPTLRYVNFVRLFFFLPVPVLFHDHYGITNLKPLDELLMFKLLKLDFYLAVNESVLKWAQNKWTFRGAGFLINLPNIEIFHESKNVNFDDTKYRINVNATFIYVSNIKYIKNQIFALEFSQKVGKEILFIGNNQDNAYFNDLTNRSNQKVIENEVNPFRYFNKCKFGIFTSPMETGPLVILEYFVSGLPFLAYKTGGISEVLYKYVPEYFMDDFVLENWVTRYKLLSKDYKRIPEELIEEVLNTEFNRGVYKDKLMIMYRKCIKLNY